MNKNKSGDWTFPDIENLLGRRELGKSTFDGRWGIPKILHNEFRKFELTGVDIYAFGNRYEAKVYDTLENLNLDFSTTSLPDLLSEVLNEEKKYLYSNFKKRERKRLPEGMKVYIDFYKKQYYLEGLKTPRYRYVLEIYRQQPEINVSVKKLLKDISEDEIENVLNSNMNDDEFREWLVKMNGNAGIKLQEGLVKVRVFQKKVIMDLKRIYKGSCQICGFSALKEFNKDISEAHHIEHFSKSCNNNPENIIILCPNHHRLIHKLDFKFNRERRHFIFDNKILKVQFDVHLNRNVDNFSNRRHL